MKILLGLFLCLSFVVNSFASPLIFKATKEINSDDNQEIATFDASKYKQIRVLVQYENKRNVKQNTPSYSFIFSIQTIDEGEPIYFDNAFEYLKYYETPKSVYFQKTYDSPPPILRFSGHSGTYWIYVYGQ